jgi:lactoylglutathione lyase
MDASTRFYVELFGMEVVPSPDFGYPVVWLRVGDLQLHLFDTSEDAPPFHHLGFDVDDVEAFYVKLNELGLLAHDRFGSTVRELVGGEVQMYLHDPAGNLIELNFPDASQVDRTIVPMAHIEDERPQEGERQLARLYQSGERAAR